MAVLNTTSPARTPVAPMEIPWNTVPSANARMAASDTGLASCWEHPVRRTRVRHTLVRKPPSAGLRGGLSTKVGRAQMILATPTHVYRDRCRAVPTACELRTMSLRSHRRSCTAAWCAPGARPTVASEKTAGVSPGRQIHLLEPLPDQKLYFRVAMTDQRDTPVLPLSLLFSCTPGVSVFPENS